jgi:hypothetical protein
MSNKKTKPMDTQDLADMLHLATHDLVGNWGISSSHDFEIGDYLVEQSSRHPKGAVAERFGKLVAIEVDKYAEKTYVLKCIDGRKVRWTNCVFAKIDQSMHRKMLERRFANLSADHEYVCKALLEGTADEQLLDYAKRYTHRPFGERKEAECDGEKAKPKKKKVVFTHHVDKSGVATCGVDDPEQYCTEWDNPQITCQDCLEKMPSPEVKKVRIKGYKTYGYRKDAEGLPDVTFHQLCMDEEIYAEKVKEWEDSYDEEYDDHEMIHPDCQTITEGMGSDVTLDDNRVFPRTLSGLPLPHDGYNHKGGDWRKFSMSCHDLRRVSDQIKRVCQCPDCKPNNLYTKIDKLEAKAVQGQAWKDVFSGLFGSTQLSHALTAAENLQQARDKQLIDAVAQNKEKDVEIKRLNEMINEMLKCVNNDCTCRKGFGVCNQCKEMVMKHRGELS